MNGEVLVGWGQALEPELDLLTCSTVVNPEAFTHGAAALGEKFSFEVGRKERFDIPLIHPLQGQFVEHRFVKRSWR
jgi:hypothetical protein